MQKTKLNIKLIDSGSIDLDILPLTSDKGQAMQFLRQRWKFAAKQTVVCSDLGNDIALFAVSNERGIMSGMLTKGYSYDTINIVTSHKTFVLGGLWKVLNILGS